MGELCLDCRKRVLTDVTTSVVKQARTAPKMAPPAGSQKAAAPSVPAPAPAPEHLAGCKHVVTDEARPRSPPAVHAAVSEPVSPPAPSTPPAQIEQRSAHLLIKACEREQEQEERADAAEAALKATKARLAEMEARAEEAESKLEQVLERIKLLELQQMQRLVTGSAAGSKMSESVLSEQAASELQGEDGEAGSDGGSNDMVELAEDWPTRVATWDAAAEETEVVQLRLELEETAARLTMSREAEERARRYAEAAGERMDALSGMLRGTADIAFTTGTNGACAARRIRHHLFRCLDVDCDGFLGGGDLQHWYRISEQFLDTQGYDPVSFKALQAQLADAMYNPTLPQEFKCQGKVSLLELSRSGLGGGIVATLLNLDNLMQDRNTSEWGAARPVSLS